MAQRARGVKLLAPEDEERYDEEFEPEEDEEDEEDEGVEDFEALEGDEEVDAVEEFDGFDENAPDDIASSGFKTKGGEIPGYEPTVDEVLSYAMGKTKDPSEPTPPKEVGESLASILDKAHAPLPDVDAGEEPPDALDNEGEEDEEDELADIFDDEEDKD